MTTYNRADCAANVTACLPTLTNLFFTRAGQGATYMEIELYSSVASALAASPYLYTVVNITGNVYRVSWL